MLSSGKAQTVPKYVLSLIQAFSAKHSGINMEMSKDINNSLFRMFAIFVELINEAILDLFGYGFRFLWRIKKFRTENVLMAKVLKNENPTSLY